MNLIVPGISSLMLFAIITAVRSIEIWQSCPQACMKPSFWLAKGSPVFSFTERPSISPRSRKVLPGFPP